ncbi:MAG: tryptophan--tRNA ligase [Planctomycetota bacterium]|nr:tryptophan--tRNA ligase [Planctomycetota bacterium]
MRYLSGIQPSGVLHLGNYFGAIRQHIASQDDNECYYFIASYHALTSLRDAEALRENVRNVALDYLALGLDPEKVAFFRQSDVPGVTELTWLLSTVTPMGLLMRCHGYKDKVDKGMDADHGLFAYPVLMASDILIYDSNKVPVGRDQVQHIEVTRDVAQRFNHIYGETFVIPEYQLEESAEKVPGTDGEKMSKSYGNTLEIFAPEKVLKKKIAGIVTDSKSVEEPKDPESNTIFQLYCLVGTSEEVSVMADRFRQGGYGYGEAKKELLRKILEYFEPYRKKREELAKDPERVEAILQDGARKARETASKTLQRARRAVGLE